MEHLSNINKLEKDGYLVLAEPFIGDKDLRGIFIFETETLQESDSLCQTDPATESGVLTSHIV